MKLDEAPTYLGKYKGSCINNQDPKGLARIQVQVADVLGYNVSNWAMPCLPFAGAPIGPQSGFYLVPPQHAGVWVEFEQGDIDRPIWTGCFWRSTDQVPPLAHAPPPLHDILLQSPGQYSISMSDTKGIQIRSPSGAVIVINDIGITLNNGKGATVDLVGNAVAINGSGLIVA